MVFSSLIFIFAFLPIALVSCYLAKLLKRTDSIFLMAVLSLLSMIFYFFSSGKMFILLLASVLINWYSGKFIINSKSIKTKKIFLTIGILLNVSLLLYFKYTRFFLNLLGWLINQSILSDLNPYLPVGISFYTFMAIAYLIDIYKNAENRASLLEMTTFLSLFPHLVAGPIVRFSEISSDLRRMPDWNINMFYNGIVRFSMGLGMKVLIADNLSPTVDKIFALDELSLTTLVAWLGAIAYSFQIYFDFAGYSTMAIGLALMFGFHFPENFNRPYLSTSITIFWQRWHMSLSKWLRDYLYIPLGGNRKKTVRTYINLMIVFLVCGLWHGAAINFVLWGLYHGFLLIIERLLKNKFGFVANGVVGLLLTFFLVMIGWILFRVESVAHFIFYLKIMFTFPHISDVLTKYQDPLFISAIVGGSLFSFAPNIILNKLQKISAGVYAAGELVIIVLILFFSVGYMTGNDFKPFIYFRF